MKNIERIMTPVFEGSRDPTEACTRVGDVYQPHKLDLCQSSEQLEARMKHVDIKSTSLSRLEYKARIHIESEPFKNFYLIMLPTSGQFHVNQNDIEGLATRRSPVVLDTNKKIDMRWSRECSNLIYKINRPLLESVLMDTYYIDAHGPIEFNTQQQGMSELNNFSAMLKNILIDNPLLDDIANNKELFEKIEQVLALSLLSCPNSYSERILNGKYHIQPRSVVKAKEFMDEHYAEKLSVIDIAKQVGVSARSLQKGFQQFEHTSPMLYLRKLRLRRARELIMFSHSQGADIKISDIAMRCGFYHFGHFSKLYVNAFGETPSSTISASPSKQNIGRK